MKLAALFLSCSLFGTALTFAVFYSPLRAEEKAPVEIGVILSLSGDLAPYGLAIQRGMQLAAAKSSLRLRFEDDRSLSRTAALSAAQELVNIAHVPVILNGVVNTIAPLAQLLNSTKTLGLVVWDSNETIAQLGDYVFGFGYSTELAGEVAADFTLQKLTPQRVCIISSEDEWSELISRAFERRLETERAVRVMHDRVGPQEVDFRPLILRAKAASCDVMYAPLYGRGLMSWMKQTSELGLKGARVTGDGISDHELTLVGKEASDGLFAILPYLENESFLRRFQDAYGERPSGVFLALAAQGFDSVNCIAQLQERLRAEKREFTGSSAREALKTYGCRGELTGDVSFTASSLSQKRERVLVARGTRFEKY